MTNLKTLEIGHSGHLETRRPVVRSPRAGHLRTLHLHGWTPEKAEDMAVVAGAVLMVTQVLEETETMVAHKEVVQ